MRIYTTRDVEVNKPYPYDVPIYISPEGFIIDGNHRFQSHFKFGTPLRFEVLPISELREIDLTDLVLSYNVRIPYLPSEMEWLLNTPIVVKKHKGIYKVMVGNNRVMLYQDLERKSIPSRVIK